MYILNCTVGTCQSSPELNGNTNSFQHTDSIGRGNNSLSETTHWEKNEKIEDRVFYLCPACWLIAFTWCPRCESAPDQMVNENQQSHQPLRQIIEIGF